MSHPSQATQLRQHIEGDVFDYQQLTGCLAPLRKPRDRISRLLARGDIVRVRKGLYTFAAPLRRRPLSRELLANLVYGPSYVSLDYALAHHGLIPEGVAELTSVTPGRSRRFDTPFGVFSYRHLPERRYAVGADLQRDGGVTYLMATAEKALADKVWADKRLRGSRPSDLEPYLLDDLRLDLARLAALDPARLRRVAAAYSSRKIDALFRCLETLRSGSHA